MNGCSFVKMKELGNGNQVEPEARIRVFIIIFVLCLFISGCSTKEGVDLIGMGKGPLEELLNKTSDSPLRVDILNELAYWESWNGGQKPLDYAKSAEDLAKKINYREGLVYARCILGHIYFLNGDFDKSKLVYEEALELLESVECSTGKAMAYNGIARYHQIRGEYARALENFLKSEDICKNTSDKKNKRVLAGTYYGLGALYYYDPEDYQEARKNFKRSLDLGKEIKNDIIITSGYYTIGVQHQSLEEFKEAEENFQKCLNLSEEIGLIYNQANAYEGLGDVYVGQVDELIGLRNMLVGVWNMTSELYCKYSSLNNLFEREYILIRQYSLCITQWLKFELEKKYNAALKKYKDSYELFLKTGNIFQIAEIEKRLGRLYNKIGDYTKLRDNYQIAIAYLDNALKRAQGTNIPKTVADVCEEIIKSYEALNNDQNTSPFYKKLLDKNEFLRKNEMLKQKLIIDFKNSEQIADNERIKGSFLLIGVIGLSIALMVVLGLSIKLRKQKAKIEEQAERLAEALKIEKEISNHKDDLMNTVYHQYKTPLANIDSSVQVLKEYFPKLSGQEIENQFNKILTNLEKMVRLIDQLSMFGKKFNPADYSLDTICRAIVEEIKSNEGSSHTIEFDSSDYCGKVKLDKDILEIMLQNLVNNAIKFSPEGSKIRVELLCEAEYVVIKVSDNGIGIPEDYLKLPFERFHRGSNVKAIPGTGLGLSIVKRYTELHDGDISIDSQLNAGTTVTIKIPKNSHGNKGDHNV